MHYLVYSLSPERVLNIAKWALDYAAKLQLRWLAWNVRIRIILKWRVQSLAYVRPYFVVICFLVLFICDREGTSQRRRAKIGADEREVILTAARWRDDLRVPNDLLCEHLSELLYVEISFL